jgi:hypothetical protein
MKYALYKQLAKLLTSLQQVELVTAQYPSIDKNTLLSIFSQLNQLNNKKQSKILRANTELILNAFNDGEDILTLAKKYSSSACQLIRLIIVALYPNYGKSSVTERLLNPQLFTSIDNNARLTKEIIAAIDSDPANSPAINAVKLAIGREYEQKLENHLKQHGIAYYSEEELKQNGYSKTPDVKLIVPIAITHNSKHYVVNWIDSKASFGDLNALAKYSQQFQSYHHRFGSGLVIFWFDFIENYAEIIAHKNKAKLNYPINMDGVLLFNRFPEKNEICTLSTPAERQKIKEIVEMYRESMENNIEIAPNSMIARIDMEKLREQVFGNTQTEENCNT